jgi:hypothetical protein
LTPLALVCHHTDFFDTVDVSSRLHQVLAYGRISCGHLAWAIRSDPSRYMGRAPGVRCGRPGW